MLTYIHIALGQFFLYDPLVNLAKKNPKIQIILNETLMYCSMAGEECCILIRYPTLSKYSSG